MLDVLHWLPLQQRIMFRIGPEVYPPRSLLSHHTGHRGRRGSLCSICSYLHICSYPCILGGWPNGLPLSQRLPHFTLASKLFSLAVQGSGALLSSNLEGALYKSP